MVRGSRRSCSSTRRSGGEGDRAGSRCRLRPLDHAQERLAEVALARVAAAAPAGGSDARMRPSRMSSSRSQWPASSITWLETSRLVPPSASSRNIAHRSRRRTGSRPTVGSSSTSSCGSFRSAVASETRARWPPESRSTTRSANSRQPDRRDHGLHPRGRRPEHAARSSAGSRAPRGRRTPTAPASRSRRARRRAGDPAGSPRTVTLPDATIWTPTIARMSVDLPQPLGPSRPVTAPAATSRETPRSTSVPPRCTCRSRTDIAGAASTTPGNLDD